jgi:hypothetical protein
MMADVLATEMKGNSVQSYLPIIALRGFEMINAVDKTQGFKPLGWTPRMCNISHMASFWRLYF